MVKTRQWFGLLGLLILLQLSACSGLKTSSMDDATQVHHVVLVWLKDSPSKPTHKQQVLTGSEQLRSIPGLQALHLGTAIPSNRKIVDDSFDVGLHMVFASEQAMKTYLKHPTHVRFVKSIKPQIKKLLVYDF